MQSIVTADFISIIILIIALSGLINQGNLSRSSRSFCLCCGCVILTLIFDILCYSCNGPSFSPFFLYFITITVFALGALCLTFYLNYCYLFITEKTEINLLFFAIPIIVSLLSGIYVIVLGFAGKILEIKDGYATLKRGFPLINTFIYLCIYVYIGIFTFAIRRKIGIKNAVCISIFGVAPFISMIVSFFTNGSDYSVTSFALSLSLIYVLMQNTANLDKEQEQLTQILKSKQQLDDYSKIVSNAGLGIWYIFLKDEKEPRMRPNAKMIDVLGIGNQTLTEEEIYNFWYDRIVESEIPSVSASVKEMIDGKFSENTYKWNHPTKGIIYVRCGGTAQKLSDGTIALSGYHADVNDIVLEEQHQKDELKKANKIQKEQLEEIRELNMELEKEQEQERLKNSLIGSLSHAYFCIYHVDLATANFQQIKEIEMPKYGFPIGKSGNSWEKFDEVCKTLVVEEDREEFMRFTNLDTVAERLQNQEVVGLHFKGIHIGWCEGLLIAVQRDENNVCKSVLWVVRNIQKEKAKELKNQQRLQKALDEAKKANASKTVFLSQMSHDIRTPLNGILGLLEISEKHSDDIELLSNNRKKAKVAADHLLSLISDVLELSKLDDSSATLANEVFNIMTLAQDVYTIIEAKAIEEGISLIKVNPNVPDFPYVYGSPLHVRQILINIFSNAIKYNKPNGKIECYAQTVSYDDEYVNYRFVIKDTGIGMSPEFMEHMYEPFMQERHDARSTYNGTGLGMSIVKTLMDKMNGTIDVKSKLGEGTTFTLTIPFKIASPEDIPNKEEDEVTDLQGVKVLLVEDNELNMEIAKTILEDFGVSVVTADNGQTAFETFRDNKPGSFDVILMDLMMPVMDGFESTKHIRGLKRQDAKTIPIIAMTANAFAEDAQRCIKGGMNAHLAKPIQIAELTKTLAKVLHK